MDSRRWDDIAYSFLVDDNGAVYEGRGAGVVGSHTGGDNSASHAICFMGDFSKRNPTDESLSAAAQLVAHGRAEGWWPNHITGGHRTAPGAQTACPGDRLLRKLPRINELAAALLRPPTPKEDDMPLGLSIDDDRRTEIRLWFRDYLGRGFKAGTWPDGKKYTAAEEQNLHLWIYGTKGRDLCLAGILDSDEAKRLLAA